MSYEKRKEFIAKLLAGGLAISTVFGSTYSLQKQHNLSNEKVGGNVLTDPKTQEKKGETVYSLEGKTLEGLTIYNKRWKELEPLYSKLENDESMFDYSYSSMSQEERKVCIDKAKQDVIDAVKKQIALAVEEAGIKCEIKNIRLFSAPNMGEGFFLGTEETHGMYSSISKGSYYIGRDISKPIEVAMENWEEMPADQIGNHIRAVRDSMRYCYIKMDGKQFIISYVSPVQVEKQRIKNSGVTR